MGYLHTLQQGRNADGGVSLASLYRDRVENDLDSAGFDGLEEGVENLRSNPEDALLASLESVLMRKG